MTPLSVMRMWAEWGNARAKTGPRKPSGRTVTRCYSHAFGRMIVTPLAFLTGMLLGCWAPGHRRLAGWVACGAVGLLPSGDRERYRAEFLAELDWLDVERQPMLRVALGMLATACATRIALQAKDWVASSTGQRLGRLEPLWAGLVSALGVFAAVAAGWQWRQGQPPNRAQLAWAGLAAVAAGGLAAWQTWKARPRDSSQAPHRRSRNSG